MMSTSLFEKLRVIHTNVSRRLFDYGREVNTTPFNTQKFFQNLLVKFFTIRYVLNSFGPQKFELSGEIFIGKEILK